MGYILPVQQFTYQDYHRRTQPENISPYAIQRAHPVLMKKMPDAPDTFSHKQYNYFQEDRQIKQEQGRYINVYV